MSGHAQYAKIGRLRIEDNHKIILYKIYINNPNIIWNLFWKVVDVYAELKSELIFRNLAFNEIHTLLNCKQSQYIHFNDSSIDYLIDYIHWKK